MVLRWKGMVINMNYVVVSYTARGGSLNKKLCRELENRGHAVRGYSISKYAEQTGLLEFSKTGSLLKEIFSIVDGIIFISACGIAVRGLAPFLRSKGCDPGVVVLDEGAHYAISLLSGHIGGGNSLCKEVANLTGATAVITTATDINQVFTVDTFAKENGLWINDLDKIKKISAEILDGNQIGLYCEYPINGKLPKELTLEPLEIGICISNKEYLTPFPITLNLIPRNFILGIGCKKSTPMEVIESVVEEVLHNLGLNKHQLGKIASIDLKASEDGIIAFAKKLRVEFVTYSSWELNNVPGEYTESSFVNQTVGVGNVCERSAAIASNCGRKIIGKTTKDGVAIAIYQMDYTLKF